MKNQRFMKLLKELDEAINNPLERQRKVWKERNLILPILIESEKMPTEKLLSLARKIKPLVRVHGQKKMNPESSKKGTKLVFIKPCDIRQSFYYNFTFCLDAELDDDNKVLYAKNLKEVGHFTCFHRYGGYWQFLRPGVDEVLQQLPSYIDVEQVDAFEICFPSLNPADVYNSAIDRHVSTVILYKLQDGLPEKVKQQDVIIADKVYPFNG